MYKETMTIFSSDSENQLKLIGTKINNLLNDKCKKITPTYPVSSNKDALTKKVCVFLPVMNTLKELAF